MSTSHTSVTSRTEHFIMYIILTDFEDEDDTPCVVFAPLLRVRFTTLAPFIQPPPTRPLPTIAALVLQPGHEIPLRRPYRLRPDGPLMMRTPKKRIRTLVALPPAIEAAITNEIDAPPHKRVRLSSPSTSSPSSPPLSPLPLSSHKRSRSPSPPPLPLSSSLPSDVLPPLTGELVHHTVPLLAAKLIRHKSLIEEIHDHLREVSLKRIETLKQEVETLHDRADITE
ncbi:hypothetical protein Tco_1414554 [Tanacetum coccineum]